MLQKLREILEDHSGKISFLRVSSAITLLTVLGTWIGKNISGNGMVDFGPNMLLVILTVISGKVISGFIEAGKSTSLAEINKDKVDPTADGL